MKKKEKVPSLFSLRLVTVCFNHYAALIEIFLLKKKTPKLQHIHSFYFLKLQILDTIRLYYKFIAMHRPQSLGHLNWIPSRDVLRAINFFNR